MARNLTAYENNDVEITIERIDNYESNVNANGKNLIVISNDTVEDFKHEISAVLDKYRI